MKIADAYHSALYEQLSELPKVDRTEDRGSVAFVHDVEAEPLPADYDTCDLLYSETPWVTGFKTFNARAGKETEGRYGDWCRKFWSHIEHLSCPMVFVNGYDFLRYLPEPDQVIESTINGGGCLIIIYGDLPLFSPYATLAETEMLEWLATRYHRIGDPCCGYGRSGRIFVEAGGSYVMSDINPHCIGYIDKYAKVW
jgi:hypothetical protein